jgi:ADP-ribose pyrophosphatase
MKIGRPGSFDRRHRFIVDRWVWELPGGYVDDGENPGPAAPREAA